MVRDRKAGAQHGFVQLVPGTRTTAEPGRTTWLCLDVAVLSWMCGSRRRLWCGFGWTLGGVPRSVEFGTGGVRAVPFSLLTAALQGLDCRDALNGGSTIPSLAGRG